MDLYTFYAFILQFLTNTGLILQKEYVVTNSN
jgi:hypothetical protein